MAKAAPRAASRAKPVSKKKKAPARKSAIVAQTADALAAQLATSSGLDREELLRRALLSFAAANGIAVEAPAAEAPPPAPEPEPVKTKKQPAPSTPPPKKAEPLADDSANPSLAPSVRLYCQGAGRPPGEMIDDTFVIGSNPKANLIVYAPKIQPKHLLIERHGLEYYATDLTPHATILHGKPIAKRQKLEHQDDLYLAGFHRVRIYILTDT